jgi:hypothetical protein
MHDTPIDWATYLEDLERQAVLLRRRPPAPPVGARVGAALAALLPRRARRVAAKATGSGPDRG